MVFYKSWLPVLTVCMYNIYMFILKIKKRNIFLFSNDMPFWKKDNKKDTENGGKPKEKINYKARLEHKQYLVICYNNFSMHRLKAFEINSVSLHFVSAGKY